MYPEECCGYLVGRSTGNGERTVTQVRPVTNQVDRERGHRFVIPADEILRAEAELASSDHVVIGFYHSHPDHPPRPSELDREHAWPWYSYLVLAVEDGRAGALAAFELDSDSRTFKAVGLTSRGASDIHPGPSGSKADP